MIRALAALLLLAGVAGAQFPTTPNLGLSLGPDARENGNWQTLDATLCQQPNAPTPCANGGGAGGGGTLPGTVLVSVPAGTADATGIVQAAIDTNAATLVFPPGTYPVCNLQPRAPNQIWQGAGREQAFLVGTAGCNNPIATSNAGIFGGPAATLTIDGITFRNAVQNDLTINCRDVQRVVVRNCSFDTCNQNGIGVQSGLQLQGCQDGLIEDNEFYSSCAHKGKAIVVNASSGVTIRRNTISWTSDGIVVQGAASTQPTGVTVIDQNTIAMNWWAGPTRYTNSGATVTYGANTLTDTAANFTGLCGDTGAPGACAGAIGNFVRVMTPLVNGTNGTFNTGGLLTDATAGFVVAGVRRGDLIRTTPVCLGNGAKPPPNRFVCTGAASLGLWGDSCVCNLNADCASGICAPRFGVVLSVGNATTLQADEWVQDIPCPLGSALCPITNSRRPTGAILSTAGVPYTIYRWTMGVVASYTGTVITTNSAVYNWFDWNGTTGVPAGGTLYEILYAHPNIPIQAGFTSNQQNVSGLRVTNNTIEGGWADNIFVVGQNFTVANNTLLDGQDHGIDIQGSFHTVTGNQVGHMGVRGVACINTCNDSVIANNTAWDTPWVNSVGTTSFGDLVIQGSRNTVAGNKVSGKTPVTNNRYGIVVTATSDQNQFQGNTCTGTYTVGCYRFDGAGSTNNHLVGYHGESISNNAGTYAIEGGLATFAQTVTAGLAPQNGSTLGCTDCTAASPCVAGGGGGGLLKRQGAAWNCP